MKNFLHFACSLLVASVACHSPNTFETEGNLKREQAEEVQSEDYFFMQHSFPYGKIDYEGHRKAALTFRIARTSASLKTTDYPEWQFAGPVNIGGRIVDVEFDPTNLNVAFLGAATGGVFKTTDGGISWAPLFDNETTLSIGDIAIAPSNTSIIYVGTGEANGGSGSLTYDANGIYKSTDGGSTWTNVGLQNTHITGRVAVHPTDPDIVFAATMGDLYGPTPDRGLYKSTDGGATWTNVLFVNDSTGAVDVVINPQNPDIIFATTWMRTRHANRKDYAGVESGVWKSTDGGNTFVRLDQSNGLPSTNTQFCRIGIDLCASSPNVLYCLYLNEQYSFHHIYKSTNDGANWSATNDNSLSSSMGGGQGYWYGRVKCDPTDPDILYLIGFDMYKTNNGGNSYGGTFNGVHVDEHAISVHPLDHNYVLCGNDGGLYTSHNGGSSWTYNYNLPLSQNYRVEVDELNALTLYCGLQDNGTARTYTGIPDEYEWIYGGDGMQALVKTDDSESIIAGYQYGEIGKSVNGGSSWFSATSGISGTGNWNYPLTDDPQNANRIYTGTQRVFRSDDFGNSWNGISPELTQYDVTGNLIYGTITFIDVSPLNGNIIYAGTDDGKVWNTINGGLDWTEIDNGLPVRWVTCVETDPFDEHTAYVTISGYRFHDNINHVYMTDDDGQTWIDIGSNLPDVPCNCILADPDFPERLYLATDVGVYYSLDAGGNWMPLGTGMPIVVCTDLKLHEPTRKLVVGTYGRSIYTLDLNTVTGGNPISESSLNFNVFPNPVVSETAHISFALNQDADAILSLIDLNGRTIMTQKISGVKGENSLELNVKNAVSGLYFIVLSEGGNESVQKIVIP